MFPIVTFEGVTSHTTVILAIAQFSDRLLIRIS